MSKRAMASIEDNRIRIDDSLEQFFRTNETTAERLRALDLMSDEEVRSLSRKVVEPKDEADPEDDPEADPDDSDETEEKDDPEDEDLGKDRSDEEGDDSDDGDDDGGEDDDRAMHDASVLSGYSRPAIPNRYSGVLRRR